MEGKQMVTVWFLVFGRRLLFASDRVLKDWHETVINLVVSDWQLGRWGSKWKGRVSERKYPMESQVD